MSTNHAELPNLQFDRYDALKQILINFKKDSPTRKTKVYFQKRLAQVERLHGEFLETHTQIVCLELDQKDPYFAKRLSSEFEEAYFDVSCTITEAFEEAFPPSENCIITTHPVAQPQTSHSAHSIQLPNLPAPTFSGRLTEWPGFHDAFRQLIHSNQELSIMQKFHFLKKALPRDRDLDIHQMPLVEMNYNTAWELLLKRYDNPRILFMHYMNTLYELPHQTKERSEDIKAMLNVANVCRNAFSKLKIPIEQCDHWIAHYLTTKLSKETHESWEHHLGSKIDIPTFLEFEQFLYNRLVTIDAIEHRNATYAITTSKPIYNSKSMRNTHVKPSKGFTESKSFHTATQETNCKPTDQCALCGDNHILRRCSSFLNKDCFGRKAIVDRMRVCLNCLSKSHTISQCTSTKNCQLCGQRHHTLLHFPTNPMTSHDNNNTHAPSLSANSTQFSPTPSFNATLLATALVTILNVDKNRSIVVRALIDQGSEGTIISEHATQVLGLKRNRVRAHISGVGNNGPNQCKTTVSFTLRSCYNSDFALYVDTAYVLNTLTSTLPSQPIVARSWSHIEGLRLADPHFYQCKPIDLIIGADLLAQILFPEQRITTPDNPIAQNTRLGWVLFGRVKTINTSAIQIKCHHAELRLEALVQKFFEIEKVPEKRILSAEDQWCENFFVRTHTRLPNGKYLVRLPLKTLYDSNQTLGKSKQLALNRFHRLERRLQQRPEIREQYHSALQEYFDLQQIVPAITTEEQHSVFSSSQRLTVTSCVLAHHAVIKEESLTTKMRIVFDASAKTSNGRSLNDILCVGPPLQNDLIAVLLNWRMHKFVFAADIQKMYRCIDMHHDDAQYQRILWRDKSGVIKEYCLTTVTFGTVSAPYTAIRVIHQLAEDEKHRYPMAERVLKSEIYVDDVLTGSDSISSTIELRNQTIAALESAGMALRKWASNSTAVLNSIPSEHQCSSTILHFDSDETVKALGMCWQPNIDSFKFKRQIGLDVSLTKRGVLSIIARLFDPLGLITPVVITAKMFLKSLWAIRVEREDRSKTALDWDEALPSSLCAPWQQFLSTLPEIENILIPRWVQYLPNQIKSVELHAFCDGSSSAYAASCYLRVQHTDDQVFTSLLIAKSKVTPNKSLTIPRIELCGAVLAVDLITWVKAHLNYSFKNKNIYFWTDATIVLHWIAGDIHQWKTFVANRIGHILETSSPRQWGHVSTIDNPSDCSTRGLTPAQLSTFELWWKGPRWLSQPKEDWPQHSIQQTNIDKTLLENKQSTIYTLVAIKSESILFKYSSLTKLLRITAIILRFRHNALQSDKASRHTGSLSVEELKQSLYVIVRLVQIESFGKDIHLLKSDNPLPSKSKLKNFTPIIDENGILRVRGRLQRASISYQRRHPIILPSVHHFTDLVIQDAHLNTLHGGVQLTLTTILKQFWILSGRRSVRRIVAKCVKCFRTNPKETAQLMGNLPYHRVNPPHRAFLATGVDYTGAIELKSSKYRGNTVYKGYIAIFICLATKAIHLEAVTGMSTECFLWALQRFIGRRGVCHDMYSDCGTNFLGADRVLQTNRKKFIEAIDRDIIPKLAGQGIQWHFNPPHSPNFGGLWEANVKSVKYHLKRTIQGTKLTYEELSTVLVRIEACLNSRPLCPLTPDSDDLEVLTPGHFLIGDALLSPPEAPSFPGCLSRQFIAIQHMVRHFWTRWSTDWLSHLQARPKWHQEHSNLRNNDLVIIKDDRIPPNHWLLGRIVELHPGADGLVRVVTVYTKNGTYKRSISKICRLPIPSYTEESTEPRSAATSQLSVGAAESEEVPS